MKYVRSFWRKLVPPAAIVVCWLAAHGSALAAAAEAEEKPGAGAWVPSYGLVLLGIGLGVLGVCLTGKRRERDKPETYTKTRLVD